MRKNIDLEPTTEDDFGLMGSAPAEMLRPQNNPAIVAPLPNERERLFWEVIAGQFGDLEPGRPDDDARMLSSLELPVEALREGELENLVIHCNRVSQAFELFGGQNFAAIFGEIAAALEGELDDRRRVAEVHAPKGKARARERGTNGARAPKSAEARDA